jgi:hypothetical protein
MCWEKAGRRSLALIAGQGDAEQLADPARGLLRAKIPQLQYALYGVAIKG